MDVKDSFDHMQEPKSLLRDCLVTTVKKKKKNKLLKKNKKKKKKKTMNMLKEIGLQILKVESLTFFL